MTPTTTPQIKPRRKKPGWRVLIRRGVAAQSPPTS
jgi:hypothetical protein